VGANGDVRVFFGDAARDVEFTGGGVEVGAEDGDGEGGADGGGDGAAGGGGFAGYFADGGGAEDVVGADEVVEVPLEEGALGGRTGKEGQIGYSTMSSGSLGMRVAVPEPSRSLMSLRTSLILIVVVVVAVVVVQ